MAPVRRTAPKSRRFAGYKKQRSRSRGLSLLNRLSNNLTNKSWAQAFRRKVSMMRSKSSPPKYTPTRRKLFVKSTNTVEAIHGEITRRWFNVICGPRGIKVSKGVWKLNSIEQQSIVSSSGQQGVNYLSILTKAQLVTSSGAGYNSGNQAYICCFDGNPYQVNTGSFAGDGPASTSPPLDDRIRIVDVKKKITWYNGNTISPVTIEVYVVMNKQHLSNDPVTEWNAVLSSQALGKPATTQETIGAVAVGGYPSCNQLGQRPDLLPAWRKNFQIKRKDSFDLAPGANLVTHYSFKFGGKTVDRKYCVDANTFVGNVTHHIMYIVKGGVGRDTTAGINTNQWSTTPVDVGIVFETEYVCCQPETNRLQYTGMFANIVTGDGITAFKGTNAVDNSTTMAAT
nr:MAG: capsid protein [Cressdnaviricota sp.]